MFSCLSPAPAPEEAPRGLWPFEPLPSTYCGLVVGPCPGSTHRSKAKKACRHN